MKFELFSDGEIVSHVHVQVRTRTWSRRAQQVSGALLVTITGHVCHKVSRSRAAASVKKVLRLVEITCQ